MIKQAELLWQRIIEKGTGANADVEAALNLQPGASDEDFQSVENQLGVTLPEEMKAMYRVHNGQAWNIGVDSFVRNLTLSPLDQVKENWAFCRKNSTRMIWSPRLKMMPLSQYCGAANGFRSRKMVVGIIYVWTLIHLVRER